MNKCIKTVFIIYKNRAIYKISTYPIKNQSITTNISKYTQQELAKLNRLQANNKQIILTFNLNPDIAYANALQFDTHIISDVKNILLNADINQIYSVAKIEYKYDKS